MKLAQSVDSPPARYLWFLTLCYVVILLLSNWFDARLVQIGAVITDAGTLLFPFSFLIADMMTEVYGFKTTRRAIWCGFLFNALFLLFGLVVTSLPSPSFAPLNHSFDLILKLNTRIVLASFVSYFCSEPVNSILLAKLKIQLQGRYIGFRFVLSTVIAAALDSVIFSFIAFYGLFSIQHLWLFILTMWLIKVAVECLGLPVSLSLVKKMKQLEKLDIYDYDTRFNLFKLETIYQPNHNAYSQNFKKESE